MMTKRFVWSVLAGVLLASGGVLLLTVRPWELADEPSITLTAAGTEALFSFSAFSSIEWLWAVALTAIVLVALAGTVGLLVHRLPEVRYRWVASGVVVAVMMVPAFFLHVWTTIPEMLTGCTERCIASLDLSPGVLLALLYFYVTLVILSVVVGTLAGLRRKEEGVRLDASVDR